LVDSIRKEQQSIMSKRNRGGGDWSGRQGHACDQCGARSEHVGPQRGFDYENDLCGACCDFEEDNNDGDNCEYLYDACRYLDPIKYAVYDCENCFCQTARTDKVLVHIEQTKALWSLCCGGEHVGDCSGCGGGGLYDITSNTTTTKWASILDQAPVAPDTSGKTYRLIHKDGYLLDWGQSIPQKKIKRTTHNNDDNAQAARDQNEQEFPPTAGKQGW
jgi:hypothetical protein